jgi:hypothetical protein
MGQRTNKRERLIFFWALTTQRSESEIGFENVIDMKLKHSQGPQKGKGRKGTGKTTLRISPTK